MGEGSIGYRFARFQQNPSNLVIEWLLIAAILSFVLSTRVPTAWFVIIIFQYSPLFIFGQWIFIHAKYSRKPGYKVFLLQALKKSLSDERLPLTEFEIFMESLEGHLNGLTYGYADDLISALRSDDPRRGTTDTISFSEIVYAIRLWLISESFARPNTQRMQPMSEVVDKFSESIMALEKNEKLCIDVMLSIYDGLPERCVSLASHNNPNSASARLQRWQLMAYRAAIISLILAGISTVAAILWGL